MRPARAALAGLINAVGAAASIAFNAILSGQAFGERLSLVIGLFTFAAFFGAALPGLWLSRSSARPFSARLALALAMILISTAVIGLLLYYGRFLMLYGEFSLDGPGGPVMSIVSGLAASVYVFWAFGLPLLVPLGLVGAIAAAIMLTRR
jgi:hypothetical protein